MNRDPKPPRPGRLPYEPPRLRKVSLVPEEATLVACKTMSVGGPGGASFKCVGVKATCSRQLS